MLQMSSSKRPWDDCLNHCSVSSMAMWFSAHCLSLQPPCHLLRRCHDFSIPNVDRLFLRADGGASYPNKAVPNNVLRTVQRATTSRQSQSCATPPPEGPRRGVTCHSRRGPFCAVSALSQMTHNISIGTESRDSPGRSCRLVPDKDRAIRHSCEGLSVRRPRQ